MKRSLLTVGLLALALPLTEASAQLVGTFRIRPGIGAQIRPDYLGADSSEIAAYPSFSITRDDEPFTAGAPDDSLGIGLISAGGFSLGPVAALRSGRKESDVGAAVGDVSRTIEAGAFAQMMIGQAIRLRGEVRHGIGGHDAIVGDLGADYVWRDGDKYVLSVGPRLRIASGEFQHSYFGVDAATAMASGLAIHDPDGGPYAVGAISGLRFSLGGDWGFFGYARYDRLIGDARDSPIVRQFGSPDQFSAGVGISRTFTIRL